MKKTQGQQVLDNLLDRFCQIILAAVFPPKCLVCGILYRIPEQSRQGRQNESAPADTAWPASIRYQAEISLASCLCPDCLAELSTVESPLCICCGQPFNSRHDRDHYCGTCLSFGQEFGIARAPLVYDRIVTALIHCFKYKGKIQLARPLGELLLMTFVHFWDINDINMILPVPLHPSRLRQRGFNQASLLIRNWQQIAQRHFYDLSHIRLEDDLLIRTTQTEPQSVLGRAQRRQNIKNAFDLNGAMKIKGESILLIDDVYTTGATVNECVRLLLSSGAQHVDVLTLARAV
jgi:ComF family protein